MEMEAVGHAGYGPRGCDIVCAGVSALLFAYLRYLKELAPEIELAEVTWAQEDGRLWIRSRGFDGGDRRSLGVVEAGLRMIAHAYPAHLTLIRMSADGTQPPKEEGENYERI